MRLIVGQRLQYLDMKCLHALYFEMGPYSYYVLEYIW
jgi:hypothetical protein